MTILEHWGSRGVYDEQFINELKSLIAGHYLKSSAAASHYTVSLHACNSVFPALLDRTVESHEKALMLLLAEY